MTVDACIVKRQARGRMSYAVKQTILLELAMLEFLRKLQWMIALQSSGTGILPLPWFENDTHGASGTVPWIGIQPVPTPPRIAISMSVEQNIEFEAELLTKWSQSCKRVCPLPPVSISAHSKELTGNFPCKC